MSYCRFSSDDFCCDVYVFEDVSGGYTTYVAANRVDFKEALPSKLSYDNPDYFNRELQVLKMVHESEKLPINLPFAGEHFHDASAQECIGTLEMLKKTGYRVPDYAIESLADDVSQAE